MTTTTVQKKSNGIKVATITIGAILAIYVLVNKWYQPTGYKGMYCNDITVVMPTAASRQADIEWQKRQASSEVAFYGMDSYIVSTSHWSNIADYNLRARRAGIKGIGFIFSDTISLKYLERFNKAQVNDSCKFSQVATEIEQYQNNGAKRLYFYGALRFGGAFCKRLSLEFVCYQGWPTRQDCDSIVKYTTRTFLHSYRPTMTASDIFGYTKGRLNDYALAWDATHKIDSTSQYNVVIIYSDEDVFQGNYFKTHTWDEGHALYTTGFNLYAPAKIKQRIKIGGRQIFTSKLAKVTRP
jgi:hypothetical protein